VQCEALLRDIKREAELSPELALRGRLICRGFRAGLAAGIRRPTTFEMVEQPLREEVFGAATAPQPEGHNDDETA